MDLHSYTDKAARLDPAPYRCGLADTAISEVVASVRRMTAIMGEIATASGEQGAGIEQINDAVTQMDDMTQQNAALVEQTAAASASLQEQAQSLVASMSVFKLDTDGGERLAAPARPARRRDEQRLLPG